MAEFISIASFNAREPAQTLASRLHEAGYDSEVFDESHEQKWHLFHLKPHAHWRVRVSDPQTQGALQKLREWEGVEPSLSQAVHCPECGSTRVEYPQFSRKTLMGALPAIAAAAGVIERDYYCESCHFTWPAEPPKPTREVDILNWPKK